MQTHWKLLLLSNDDVISLGSQNMHEALEDIEQTFSLLSRGEAFSPAKAAMGFGKTLQDEATMGRINALPGYVGGRFQMARIAVALADEGDCEEDRWAVQQQFYKYLCDNAQVVFDSVVILNHRWCILGLRDARVSSGLMKEAILDAVSQFHGNSACHFAVSSVAADLSEIGRIKGEAEAAMRFGKVFDPDLQIYFYDNYMIYHLFSRSIDNPVMIKLYEDVIKRVTIYDAEHKTSLIETLRELVLSDFNMQVTAKRLFIHRNTLYRRIEKLEELLDLTPGSVTLLGLMNDSAQRVKLLMDRELLQEPYMGCHPCINTSSIRLSTRDVLEKFLPAVNHMPVFLDLSA